MKRKNGEIKPLEADFLHKVGLGMGVWKSLTFYDTLTKTPLMFQFFCKCVLVGGKSIQKW